MNCSACGSPNEAGRKFCGECGARLATSCPACGAANTPTARFCGECGSRLQPATEAAAGATTLPGTPGSTSAASPIPAHPADAPVAERRLVSVLFADLVGFTSLSDGRDPELVRDLLSRYFDLARDIVERHGGIVEKFIGDAVMALWGAPVAHEDDAERAVRAGLELVASVGTLGEGLQARGGVLTGEAAVTLGAVGQGMVAGDLVNTASRLQSVAPPGTVLVGDATQRAASGAITFEPLDEQQLKGKQAPVAAWRAVRVVAQRRGVGREDRLEAPFVGRDAELRLLKDLFHATSRDRRVRVVSITGQAGVGKSRLAWEFLKYVDGVVDAVYWHEGRSPAYGQGLSFWALGEMVRSRADLLETDDEPTTRTKIRATVERFISDEDERGRVEAALLALLGVDEAPEGGSNAMFAAWRTFFERVAANGTVALLFEDLHWADSGTLDFIDHMLDWSLNVPILIVTLARTELLDTRPGWGAGRRNFLALDLQPLDEASMRELLVGLVDGLPEPAIRSITQRAEGIPLYAVETIRMLVADGRLIVRDDGRFEPAGELGELTIPETLHALIAARLDGLSPDDRALVQDAAVLGQSFTIEALAAVSGLDVDALEPRLAALVRTDLFRRESDPRSPERGQYAFVQAVIREVAYSTLAMRDRRARHLAAARFFESLGDDELAGALASHYLAAYRSAAEGPEAEALARQARIALRAAADRALGLGSPLQAVTYLEQALEVVEGDEERAAILEQAGRAASVGARTEEALPLLEQAEQIRERLGDPVALARVIGMRARALTDGRQFEASLALVEPALERFTALGDDPVIIDLRATLARTLMRAGHYERGIAEADRVMLIAERRQLPSIAAETMVVKGQAFGFQGRMWEARALYEGARRLADDAGLPEDALAASHNLSFEIALDDPRAAVATQREVLALARRLGQRTIEFTALGNVAEDARRTGDWDWVLAELDAHLSRHPEGIDTLHLRIARQVLLAARGQADAAEIDEIARQMTMIDDPDNVANIADMRSSVAYAEGRWADAGEAWIEGARTSDLNAPYVLPRAANAFILAGDAAAAQAALDELDRIGTRGRAVDADRVSIRGGIAAIGGDRERSMAEFRAAIAAWRALRLPWDEALTTLAAARWIGVAEPDVASWVETARATFETLRAAPMLDRLADVVAAGSGADTRPVPQARRAPASAETSVSAPGRSAS